MDDLIRPDEPWTGKVSTRRTYIQGLGQVEKFQSGSIRPSDEHWNLNVDPLGTPALSGGQAHISLSLIKTFWEIIFLKPKT